MRISLATMCFVALSAFAEQTSEAVSTEPVKTMIRLENSLAWLAKTQEADGHWDSVKHGATEQHDIEQTAWAVLCICGAGHTEDEGEHKEVVRKATQWLIAQQGADGRIGSSEKTDGAVHAVAGMALAQLAGNSTVPNTKKAAQKAVDYALTYQSKLGQKLSGFGKKPNSQEPDLYTTTLFVMFLKSASVAGLNVEAGTFDGVSSFLDTVEDNQRRNFSLQPKGVCDWKSTLMGTFSRMYVGSKKENLTPYAEGILQQWSPPGSNDTRDGFVEYLGTLVMFQQGGTLWSKYADSLQSVLWKLQNAAGESRFSWPRSGSGMLSGRVGGTAINILTLEAWCHYRK